MTRRLVLFVLAVPGLLAQSGRQAPQLTLEQKEQFLARATVKMTRGAKKGITGTVRGTLSDGTITHDASIQRIDEEKPGHGGSRPSRATTSIASRRKLCLRTRTSGPANT
jgi:hypothetical protein